MFNSVSLVGHLGNDPQVKYFGSGSCLAKGSLAVDRIKQGNKETSWIPLQVWGKTAEAIANYCKKGSKIAVMGELIQESYQDEGGNNRSSIYVKVTQVEFCGSKERTAQTSSSSEPVEAAALADEF